MIEGGDIAPLALLCRAGGRIVALPIAHVGETMRPLPIQALAGAPPFVLGLSLIRGAAIPVVALGTLIGAGGATPCTRFVTLKIAGRSVALAVDEVIGARRIPAATIEQLPPLLKEAGAELIEAMVRLDAELLLVLRSAGVMPAPLWEQLDAATSGARP